MAKMGPTSIDPKPLSAPHGTIIQEEDTKDYYIFVAEKQMWVKIMEPLQGWLKMGSGKMIHRKVVCGICGEKVDKSDAVRDVGSDTEWICDDCARELHPEYEDWGEY